MLNTEIQTETTVLILNLGIGFKKLMHIIYTQVPVHPCTLWAKKRKYMILEKKPRQTDILFKTNIRPQ